MKSEYDVIVIGGGPGGTPAAMQLAANGKKVLLVERSGKLGGACLFVGCIPSKIIKHSADQYALIKRSSLITDQCLKDRESIWQYIKKEMDRILTMRSDAARKHLNQIPSLTFSSGEARFISSNEIEILEKSGLKNVFSFKNAIIATGSEPTIPKFDGNGVQDILKSEMLFKEDELPESLVIVGGGPIGIELSQMLAKLNVKCTIVEILDTVLSGVVEPEFVSELTQALRNANIDIYTSSKVVGINRVSGKFGTEIIGKNGEKNILQSDQVMVAAGRKPSVETLGLDATNINCTPAGIEVNEFLETGEPGIYATGDVIKGPKFAHTASYEARIAVNNILRGNTHKVDFSKNSWVLFSEPEIASAGFTEADARKNGFDVITGMYDYKIDAAAQISENSSGKLKFIADKKNRQLLGIHAFVEGAPSIIGEASLIISKRLTINDIADSIHPHPTLTEAFGFLASSMVSMERT